ncbi:hypothetical protein GQ53DRAFT_821275 [Thozetella sp. PMI_491]|nr:hypothetical protein GQ53DRAFT_821275 [Thozetella sp. PMI_491]
MKCVMKDGAERCDRCTRWDQDCVFEAHRRGQWRRDHTITARSVASQGGSSDANEALQPPDPDQSTQSLSSLSLLEFAPPYDSFAHFSAANPDFGLEYFANQSEGGELLSFDQALPFEQGGLDMDIDSNLDLVPLLHYDPVDRNLLPLPMAQHLFEGFFKHFNHLVGLLDPDLFTFPYTRAASPLLFTVILCISSRVSRPTLHRPLRNHVEILLSKALLAPETSIENLWAIICIFYWKDFGDKYGYNLVGFALRMATSTRLCREGHALSQGDTRAPSSTETETEVRQRRDRERIWLVLGNLDRWSSCFTRYPLAATLVVGNDASRIWLGIDKWSYQNGDSIAVAGNELSRLVQPIYKAIMETMELGSEASHGRRSQATTDKESLDDLMGEFDTELASWTETWGPILAECTQSQSSLELLVYQDQEHARLYFHSIRLHRILIRKQCRASESPAVEIVGICYTTAMRLLGQSLNVVTRDVLCYLWDTAHITIALGAMVLLKMLLLATHFPNTAAKDALNVLAELAAIYTKASESISSSYAEASGPGQLRSSPATDALDSQARLLRDIVSVIQVKILPRQRRLGSSTGPRGGQGSKTSQSREQPRRRGAADSYTVSGGERGGSGAGDTSISLLADEMEISDDPELAFMTSCFLEAGLSPWDNHAIFIHQL